MKRAPLALTLLALTLLALGCAEPTALLVFIDSDMPLSQVTVSVTGSSDGAPDSTSAPFATADRPLRLSLVPGDDHEIGDDVTIEVRGYLDTTGDPAIERTHVTRFVEGETRYLRVCLFDVCAGVECAGDTTCVAEERSVTSECAPQSVDAERYRGEDPAPIGTTPPPVCDAACWHECAAAGAVCETPVGLALGGAHGCARTAEGHVYCWGAVDAGQLGHAATGRPAIVPGLEEVTSVAAGDRHTCATTAAGAARCWGRGMEAQLGRGVMPAGSTTPVAPNGLEATDHVDRVDARGNSTCLLLHPEGGASEVRCFGENPHRLAGIAASPAEDASTRVPDVNDALAIAVGGDHACAMTDEGDTHEVVCWGWAMSGRLGDANVDDIDEPTGQSVVVATDTPLDGVIQIAAGEQSSCALIDDGARRLRCWGPNEDGELGFAPFASSAKAVGGPTAGGEELVGWRRVAMGLRQGCGVLDGEVWCWGWGNGGALGVGATEHAAPTAVTDATHGAATDVALGGRRDAAGDRTHACAIIDGAIWCWGDDDDGQLGFEGGRVTVPTRVGG
ncbi:MAG: hypothetical protein KC619_06610 [Myxococcales bacterium]|nr:hypothetical protein [Myxococcales bacterium]